MGWPADLSGKNRSISLTLVYDAREGYLLDQWQLANVAYPASWSRAELTMGHSVAVTNAGLLRPWLSVPTG